MVRLFNAFGEDALRAVPLIKYWLSGALALTLACAPERPLDVQRLEERAKAAQDGDGLKLQPVAQVNGEIITLGEFERRIDGMAPAARVRYSTQEKRQEFLDSLVVFEVLADEAEREGLTNDPVVMQTLKEVLAKRYLDRELRRRVSMKDITDAEVQTAYEADRAAYERPEQRRAIALVLDDQAALTELLAQEHLDRLTELNARLTAFRRLAAKHNVDEQLARHGGDLGYLEPPHIAKGKLELSTALFALKEVGQMTAPIKHGDRWYALMLLEIRPAYRQPVEEVTRQIRTKLYEQRRLREQEALIQALKEKSRVQIFEDVLAKAKAPEGAAARSPERQLLKALPVQSLKPAEQAKTPAKDAAP